MYSNYLSLKNKNRHLSKIAFIAGMGGIYIAFIVLVAACFFIKAERFEVQKTFYLLAVPIKEQSVSVSVQDVYTGGGAGYALNHGGKCYVVLSAYPTQAEAKTVQNLPQNKQKDMQIVALQVNTLYFNTKSERAVKESIQRGVRTLLNCIDILYQTANAIDTAQYTQRQAQGILREVHRTVSALQKDAPWQIGELLLQAGQKCMQTLQGIIYAKDVRYLQIHLCEGIYSLQNVFSL